MPDDDTSPQAASPVPAYHRLLWPTLKALKEMGGSASNEELLTKVAELEAIPEEVQAIVHTDGRQTRLAYNLAWAKTYLKRVGAIDNSRRGVWSITEAGERMAEDDVQSVPAAVRRQVYEQRRGQPEDEGAAPVGGDMIADGAPPPEDHWKDRLLAVLRRMPPDAFERLARRVLREAGFIKVEVTGKSGDGGIDGVGVLRVNLLSFQVVFQCKRYQGSVGSPVVRDFRGGMIGRSDKGLIITTGTFSGEAKREATRDGAPAIDLIDGDQLCDLLKSLSLGVRVEMVEDVIVHEDWFAGI